MLLNVEIGDEGSSASVLTQATHVYDRLRADVLSGTLAPRQKLQMRFLVEAYGTGQTPLREGLNRLAAEGLIEGRDQRGFSVAGISQDEFAELNKTRCWIEGLALRETLKAATPAWEEDLVLAHHRLSRLPRSLSKDRFEHNPAWERQHRLFHRALIGRCGSRPLLAFSDQLADRLFRYRQLSIRKLYPSRPIEDEHRAILQVVLDRDADGAVALLEAHYQKTADAILGDPVPFGPEADGAEGAPLSLHLVTT